MINQAEPKIHEVPLRQWRLESFKSVSKATVDFTPLTLLVGSNSSGKSTLLQSILLMSQAAETINPGEIFSLNGPLVSLGAFEDVVSAWKTRSKYFGIGGTIALPIDSDLPELRRTVDHSPPGDDRSLAISWDFQFRDTPKQQHETGSTVFKAVNLDIRHQSEKLLSLHLRRSKQIELQRAFGERAKRLQSPGSVRTVGPRLIGGPSQFSAHFIGKLTGSREQRSDCFGVILRGGLPIGVIVKTDLNTVFAREWLNFSRRQGPARASRRPDDLETAVEKIADLATTELRRLLEHWKSDQQALRTIFEGSEVLTSITHENRTLIRTERERILKQILAKWGAGEPYLEARQLDSAEGIWEAQRFLASQITYLGPLRKAPQVVYSGVQVSRVGFIGVEGEHTAAVLHASKEKLVFDPPKEGQSSSVLRPLKDALGEWLEYLQLAKSVDTQSLGRLGMDMRIVYRELSKKIDLTNVGVGVSQLLPVVVSCLLTEPGSVILLEQPELHLHPAVQQRLADFLLACARSGRQLIVETHSEYIISRFRLRIAQDLEDRLQSMVSFIFVERDDRGQTHYRSIKPNRFGGLEPEVPKGFFDQTPQESQDILRAAIRKKQMLAEQAPDF
jgi:predicted ATPase